MRSSPKARVHLRRRLTPRALTLLLGWEQFLPLFAELARTTTPSPARFLLEARQGKVQAKLWLESDDAR